MEVSQSHSTGNTVGNSEQSQRLSLPAAAATNQSQAQLTDPVQHQARQATLEEAQGDFDQQLQNQVKGIVKMQKDDFSVSSRVIRLFFLSGKFQRRIKP